MADPLVSEWHSRDLDSRISSREKDGLLDWRDNSNATYHIMRDNPYHNTHILGGMFGMRITQKNLGEILKVHQILRMNNHRWISILSR